MASGLKQPHLAAILVGNDGGSETYVASKIKACERVGFKSTLIRLPEYVTEEKLLNAVYDLNNNLVKEVKNNFAVDARNTADPSQNLDALHILNFFDGIRLGTKLNSDILSGHQSTLLVQLGNISQRVGRSLAINPTNGHILNDKAAMKFWSREYEKGWEPKI